jgi:hypothetical protein
MPKYKNIKTTCTENVTPLVLPEPTAEILAKITGTSASYVKKVRNGNRPVTTAAAQKIKMCYDFIVNEQEELVKVASKIFNQPSNK